MDDFLDFLKVGLNVDIQRTDGKSASSQRQLIQCTFFGHLGDQK